MSNESRPLTASATLWIPAPASARVTFFRGNDGVQIGDFGAIAVQIILMPALPKLLAPQPSANRNNVIPVKTGTTYPFPLMGYV